MENRYDLFLDTISRCDVYLEGNWISNEIVLKTAEEFLEETLAEKKHSAALLLHTGSICYDAIAFVLCVLANIIFDENDAVEEAASIEKGSTVSYQKKLWKFEGLYEGSEKIFQGKYMLKGDNGSTMYITEASIGALLPYNGNAKKLSGKGVRATKSKRIEFLNEILNLKQNEIVATSRLTTILYMDNAELDYLLDNLAISFPEENKTYSILDLVTVTYYTNTLEFRKRGNASNNEPAIKVTNSIERARDLIVEGEESEVLGFAAFRSEAYRKNAIDFEELLKRRKLRFSWLISKLEYNPWIEAQLDDESQNVEILAFSDRLLNTIDPKICEENVITLQLAKETSIASSREFASELVESSILWKDYKRIKNKILFVMNNCLEDDNAIQFSKWSYSMLKFFNNAFFTMSEYETTQGEYYQNGIRQEFELQRAKIQLFANLIREKAEEVLAFIEKLYYENETVNEKRNRIKQYVFDNKYNNVLFVIPSIRYENLFNQYATNHMKFMRFSYHVCAEAKVKSVDLSKYDCVIFTALMNFDKVNPVDLIGAKKVVVFVYDAQIRLYKKVARDYIDYIKKINSRNPFDLIESIIQEDLYSVENETEIAETLEENLQDSDLQEAFMKVFLQSEKYQSKEYFGYQHEGGLEAYKYGQFVTGEQIIFTKGYEAYVLDSTEGTVIEKKVDELEAGDRLIFTINDDKTKDIVDELLVGICERSEDIKQAYDLVRGWKEKFRKLKYEKGWTYVDISRMFKQNNCNMTPQTIRQWIDEQSHIVGPKEKEKFMHIGKVIADSEMEDNYLIYAEATSKIRSIRIKILKLIESAVVADINGVNYDEDGMFKDTIERIREIAVIKQLERIEVIDSFKIQINRANRPIEN